MSLGDWLDERTGYRKLLHEALDEPVRGGARWAYVWGSALTLSLFVQVVTGWLLMSAYAPSATTAWASVVHISYSMRAGWLVRGLHHFGAQAMVVMLVLHLGQTALYGAYKKPRELNWLLGLGLLAATLGFALTGYLLPWDQKGYWATRVATNIAGTVPGVGAWIQQMLVGGSEYGHLTLTRFYTLHVAILPAVTIGLLVAHVALFRKHGVTPPANADLKKVDTFHPKQVFRDLVVGAAVLAILFWLSAREHGAPVDAPADPASDYPARPEWYFLALFQLLKYFKGSLEPVGAVGLPTVIGLYVVALPFLDRKPNAPLKSRLVLLAPLVAVGLGLAALTVVARQSDAADAQFQKARELATKRADRAILLARQGVPPEGPLAMMRADPETRGPELFQASCAGCHRLGELGPAAGKETAPDLTGLGTKAWVTAVLDDPSAPKLFGKTAFDEMPSQVHPPKDPEAAKTFKALTPAEIDAVADFLTAQARGEKAAGTPGEKVVHDRCTSCHRLDGKTDNDDSLGPELRGWASPAWIQAQIDDPGSGRAYPKGAMSADLKGHMPAFVEKLGDADRKLLAAWVHDAAQRVK